MHSDGRSVGKKINKGWWEIDYIAIMGKGVSLINGMDVHGYVAQERYTQSYMPALLLIHTLFDSH